MHSGVSAVATAMDQAVRRLEAALEQREAAFRRLAEQHGAAGAELKTLRDELQAVRDEAASLRERASLVDALREELAQIQNERDEGDMRPVMAGDGVANGVLAARDAEIAALKKERDALQGQLVSARAAQEMLQRVAASGSAARDDAARNDADRDDDDGRGYRGDAAALKAELAAARASQAEMQAFQSGIAARLEATMARLRQVLESDTAQ